MSNTELLLKEIEGLPAHCMGEVLDFVGYLKHKAPQENGATQKKRNLVRKPPLAQTMEELWELCKDAPITVDSFLEERHAETEREEAEYRE
ncbi:hypothetical protein AGMMS49587_11880 [Spirochaetia bacterium]|nr:hypothetical protein AGMMS49587_11880 [Spirochaetia bacterium]